MLRRAGYLVDGHREIRRRSRNQHDRIVVGDKCVGCRGRGDQLTVIVLNGGKCVGDGRGQAHRQRMRQLLRRVVHHRQRRVVQDRQRLR